MIRLRDNPASVRIVKIEHVEENIENYQQGADDVRDAPEGCEFGLRSCEHRWFLLRGENPPRDSRSAE